MIKKGETVPETGMYITDRCLVVPVQAELYDETVMGMQTDILNKIEITGLRGLVIDISGVRIMDLFAAGKLTDTCKMASLLGAYPVITGINPGVAGALADLDFECGSILTALSIDEGLNILRRFKL